MFHFPKNIFSPRCISSSHQSINLGPAGGAWEGIACDAPLHHNYHHIYRRCITFIIIFILSGLSSSLSSLSRDTQGYNVTHLRQECVTIIKLVHLIKFRSTGARLYPVSTAYQEWFSTPGNILLARQQICICSRRLCKMLTNFQTAPAAHSCHVQIYRGCILR